MNLISENNQKNWWEEDFASGASAPVNVAPDEWWNEMNLAETLRAIPEEYNLDFSKDPELLLEEVVEPPSLGPDDVNSLSAFDHDFGVFRKSKNNWNNLRNSFINSNDPLTFIDDPEIREKLTIHLDMMENPEMEKKKWALAAYMSFRYQQNLVYCHDNLGLFLNKYFGNDDVFEAYVNIRNAYRDKPVDNGGEQEGTDNLNWFEKGAAWIGERDIFRATEIGLSRFMKRTYNVLGTIGEAAVRDSYSARIMLGNEKTVEEAKKAREEIRDVYKNHYEPFEKKAVHDLNKPEDWFTNSEGVTDWVWNLTLSLIENAPSTVVDAAAAMTGLPGVLAIGGTYANDAYYEVSESNPEMSEGKKVLYSALIGTVNAIGEKVTAGIIKGADKVTLKNGVKGFLKGFFTGFVTEGVQETVESIAENTVDTSFGLRDVTDFKSVVKELLRGVPESFMIGGITGGIFDRMSAIDKARAEDRVRSQIKNKIDELSAKESLTEQESQDLETLKVLEDAEDTNELLKTVVEAFEKAQSETYENGVERNVETDVAENGKERDLTDEEIDELLIKKSEDAETRMRMKNQLEYNPQDVRDEVQRASNYFKDVKFHLVDSWDGLPFGISDKHRGRAFTDLETGDIYINASKVRPNDVFEVMLHEVVGHKGLRGVVPEAQLDAFLDEVYASHYNDEVFQDIARTYFPDKVREFQDDEGTYYEAVLEDAADQRLAAEEYLAHLAQKNTKKPGWWKQFLNKIKMWWSGTRWGKEYPVTTDQIEALLARAGRRMRKHWWNRRSQVVEGKNGIERSGTEPSGTGDVRFLIIGELGAFRLDGSFFQNNLGNLKTAKEMLASGKDAKTIKLATGWEKGGDGKWRMEIPDIKMKTERVFGNMREVVEAPVYLDGPLEYYVDAPELFAAYPYLRNIKVRMADLQTGHGAYYHNSNEIRIDRNAMDLSDQDKRRLEELRKTIRRAENWSEKDRNNAEFLGIDSNPESIKKRAEEEIAAITNKQLYWYRDILIHEIQHAIQHSEGFAIGSSPEYFEDNPVINEEVKEEYEAAVQKEYNLKKELLDERPEFLEDFNRYFELDKTYESDAQIDEQAIFDEMDRIDQRFRDAGLGDLWDRYNFAYRELIAARRKLNKGIPPYTAYHRTAGEVEARNAQKRKQMSAEEKRQSLLSETEDVAEESKIYLFEGGGRSAFAEPFSEGQSAHSVIVPSLPVNLSDTKEIRKYFFDHFKGREVEIKSDGRLVLFTRQGLEDTLKRRGEHRKSFSALDSIIEESYPVGYEIVDDRHKKKRPDLKGQFVYAALLDINGEHYIAAIKLDDTAADNRAYFKDISIKKRSLYVGQTQDFSLEVVDPSADRNLTVQQLIDFVKRDFSNSPFFSETIPGTTKKNGVERNFTDGNGIRFSVEPEEDAAYLNAVKNGDMETAQKLVEMAAEKAGYSSDDSWRMSHRAPNSKDVEKYPDGPTQKITDWQKIVPKDYFDHPEYYIDMSNPADRESFYHVKRMLDIYEQRKAEGNGKEKKVVIRMYRAVARDFNSKEDGFRNGDWITPSRIYAESEGELNSGSYRIIMKSVPLEDVYWNGDSISEFGYDDGKSYTYADTKNYRKSLDTVTYDDKGNIIPLSKRFNKRKDDVRYSIEEYSESDRRDIVAILQPFVGQVVDLKESEYRKYLLDHGVDIPEEDAKAFAVEAMRANQKLARQRGIRKRDNWLYENYPLFRMVAEVAGDNFIINPEYTSSEGEHFTGSWIAPEFVKYSGPPKKFEEFSSDKKYRQYLAAREKALKNAKGMDLSDIAEAIARKTGKDSLELKEEIKDFFRDLKKKEFYGRYTQWKKDQAFEDHALRDAAMAEWKQQEKFRIEDEVVEILQNGVEVDQEWITQNRAVYKELYRQLFGGKEAPHTPGKRDLEAINAALKQKSGDAAVFAEAYKAVRTQLEAEFTTKLNELKERILSSKADAVKLQREALEFAQQHLEKENRQEFMNSIVKLMEYSTVPNTKYPEGRRKAEFDKLLEKMVERSAEIRKKEYAEKIRKRLDQLGEKVDGGRKVRGLRDIATQKKLNRIIEISRMDAGMVNMEITKYQEVLEQKNGSGESTVEEEYQIAILNMYGNMEEKSADELQTAYNELQLLARTGKNNLLDQIEKRAAQDEADRNEFWNAVNGMKRYSSTELSNIENQQKRTGKFKKMMSQNFWQSLSLDGILEAVALFSDKENNVVQRVREMAHNADLKKKSMNMRNGNDFRNFLKETLKTDSRFVLSDTIGKWRELKSDTGVFRFVPDPEEKQFKYEVLSVTDARKLLQKHDSGQMELPDYEAEAIRQQLVTFDRKVKYDVPAEYKDGSTEKLLKEIEKENNDAESEPKVVIPKPTFKGGQEQLQLSQMSALYLKLMWDQRDVRYKMHYNGYSEETMKQIDSFLLPEVKALGEWMRDQLEADRAKISEVYEEMYFASFPKNEMYFPAVFRSNRSNVKSGAVDITQNGSAEGAIAYTPGALKVRVYHLNDVVDADALTVFQNHRLVMNHFVSHAPVARKMRSIFLNKDVENAIKMKNGNDAFNELKDGLQDFINGGNNDVKAHRLLSYIYSTSVRTKMDFNLLSGLKQTVGWISYSQEIPIGELLKGLKYAALHRKEVIETLGHTEYFDARWNGGGNAEMRLLLDQSGKVGSKKEEFFRMLDEKGSLATRAGDAFSVLFGGFAVYKYHYDNLIKRGVPAAEARKQALLKWEMATERTQQSSNVFLLNKFQRGGVLPKLFTTFMSNQILLWNNNASAVYKALKFDDKSSWKKAGMGIGALALSSLAMSAFDLMREGDDYEFTDAIWNLLADSVVGFGVVGSSLSKGIIVLSKGFFNNDLMLGDLSRGVWSVKRQTTNEKAALHRGFEGDFEITEKDVGDAVKILQAAGYVYEPAAHAGSVAREGRKWWRFFDRDEKKKKKK